MNIEYVNEVYFYEVRIKHKCVDKNAVLLEGAIMTLLM